jgi:hypothetical protein
MRKSIAIICAMVLGLGMVLGAKGAAAAPQAVTWILVKSPGAEGIWPNEANAENRFETDGGLLGRVVVNWATDELAGGLGIDVAVTDPGIRNKCELAPSYPCAAGQPPFFLLSGNGSEGPLGAGSGSECNVEVIACNTVPIPSAAHEAATAPGFQTPLDPAGGAADGDAPGHGEYSYLAIHTKPATTTKGKGIAFFSGSYSVVRDDYLCNDCPPLGHGKDKAAPITGAALGDGQDMQVNTVISSKVVPTAVELWTSQATPGAGHSHISLKAAPVETLGEFPPQGAVNVCGQGKIFQTLRLHLCGTQKTTTIPNQKVSVHTYSVDTTTWAEFNNGGLNEAKCSPPDCYVEQVIIPAAKAQAIAAGQTALAVQTQIATTVLPSDAIPVEDATVDSLLFAYTTTFLDIDGDGTEDNVDPCPTDPANGCLADLIGGGSCPAGQVFSADLAGYMICVDGFLQGSRIDVNRDCTSDAADTNLTIGRNALGNLIKTGSLDFPANGLGLPIGPFDP